MIRLEYIDLFAGAGGTTTGVENARINGKKIARVIAAVNHDALAIESHAANHPNAMHFVEDIRTLDVLKLPRFSTDPKVISILGASLECTNFSQAKGGQSRDADSRTLAEHLYRYIEYLEPDYIEIENVREFMTWGPLIQKMDKITGLPKWNKDGSPVMMPDPEFKGDDYRAWVEHICSYGYTYEYQLLNSADYGAYTSRTRYFGMFAKIGMPIVFPAPTHAKEGKNGLIRWKAVREKLELSNVGKSIFNRKIPLVQKTMDRIAYGLNKFCLDGQGEFLLSYYGAEKKADSMDKPLRTITTKDRFAVVQPEIDDKKFILEFYTRDNAVTNIDGPCKTITCQNRMALVETQFMANTKANKTKIHFISPYYGGEKHASDVKDPLPTITTVDHNALVEVEVDKHFLTQNIWGNKKASNSIDSPSPTLLTEDEKSLVTVEFMRQKNFIQQTYSNKYNVSSVETALPVITTNPKSALITVLKDAGVIKDIKMRMLTVQELKTITGFNDEYALSGNATTQKKFIGNAVVPIVPQRWSEALCLHLMKDKFEKDC